MDTVAAVEPRPWLALTEVRAELDQLIERLDRSAFAALCAEFDDPGRRWFFTGQGRSGRSAEMAGMRFMHLGLRTHVLGEATAPSVRSGDRLLVISGSGRTPVSLGFARIARAEAARVVVLTANPLGPLAELADLVFPIPATGSRQLGGSLFEQVSLITLDAVALALAQRMPDPHGSLARLHTNMQ